MLFCVILRRWPLLKFLASLLPNPQRREFAWRAWERKLKNFEMFQGANRWLIFIHLRCKRVLLQHVLELSKPTREVRISWHSIFRMSFDTSLACDIHSKDQVCWTWIRSRSSDVHGRAWATRQRRSISQDGSVQQMNIVEVSHAKHVLNMFFSTSGTSQESSKNPLPHVGKGGFSGQRTQLRFFEALGGAAFEPATGGCFVVKIWRSGYLMIFQMFVWFQAPGPLSDVQRRVGELGTRVIWRFFDILGTKYDLREFLPQRYWQLFCRCVACHMHAASFVATQRTLGEQV